jgi:hypothetical protein
MIKFSCGFSSERQAHIFGVGFEEQNFAMLQQDKPIFFSSQLLDMPSPGFQMLFLWVKNEQDLRDQLFKIPAFKESDQISCLRIADSFYLTPIPCAEGHMIYVVALNGKSLEKLRGGEMLSFRARNSSPAISVECLMFFGKNPDVIRERVEASGLASFRMTDTL